GFPTRSGRSRLMPVVELSRPETTLKNNPDSIDTIPLSSHPPSAARAERDAPLNLGISQINEPTKRCGMLLLDNAFSALKLTPSRGDWSPAPFPDPLSICFDQV